jgi:hypothetical protein
MDDKNVYDRRDDGGKKSTLSGPVLVIFGLVRPADCNARREFQNRYVNAAINTRRCAVLTTTTAEMRQANFVAQPLRLIVYKKKLKPMADGSSTKARRDL